MNLDECFQILDKYNIVYIYIGTFEKILYPRGKMKFYENVNFKQIFSNQKVDIFKFDNKL